MAVQWLQFSLWPVGAAASHVNTRTACGGRSLYGVNYQLGDRSGVHSRTVRGTDTSNSSQSTERKKTPATDARGRNALYTAMQWNDSQDLTSKTWVPLGNSITRWGWRWCWGWQLYITVAWRLLSCVMLWSPARNVLRKGGFVSDCAQALLRRGGKLQDGISYKQMENGWIGSHWVIRLCRIL